MYSSSSDCTFTLGLWRNGRKRRGRRESRKEKMNTVREEKREKGKGKKRREIEGAADR